MKYIPSVVEDDGLYIGQCSCGKATTARVRIQDAADDVVAMAQAHRKRDCGKFCFTSEEAAKSALIDAKIRAYLHHSQKRRENRHYRCRDCDAWHLTSYPSLQSAG